MKLLTRDQAPSHLTASEPYILTGYRPKLTLIGCLRSIFSVHNETFNIWSHLVGALYMAHLTQKRWYSKSTSHSGLRRFPPLLTSTVGGLLFTASATAHCCCAHGKKTCQICFAVDKSFISYYMCSCALASSIVFFRRPTQLLTKLIFMVLSISASTVGALQTSGVFGETSKLFKVLTLSSLAGLGLMPPIMEYILTRRKDVRVLIKERASLACLVALVGAFFYAKQFPEKKYPKTFDVIGQSHGIMHVMVVYCVHVVFHGFSDVSSKVLR